MKIETFSFSDIELVGFANQVKDVLLEYLQYDGVIPAAKPLCETYAVLVVRKGWFGTLMEKLLKLDKSDFAQIRIVKIEPIEHKREA